MYVLLQKDYQYVLYLSLSYLKSLGCFKAEQPLSAQSRIPSGCELSLSVYVQPRADREPKQSFKLLKIIIIQIINGLKQCHFQTALVRMAFFLIPSPVVSELSLLNCLPILLRADGVKRDKGNISVQLPCISSPPDAIIDTHFTAPHLSPSAGRIIKRLSILGLNVNNQ